MTGNELKAWRKMLGMTQTEAAASLGVSRPFIAKYESQNNIPQLVEMACSTIAISSARGETLVNLLRGKHHISDYVSIFGQIIERFDSGLRVLNSCNLEPDVVDWMAGHCPTSRFSLKPLILGCGDYLSIFDVPIMEFSSARDQSEFEMWLRFRDI